MSTAEQTDGDETPWSEVTPEAARRLLVAAVEAFAERGYHATTTRDIAGRAGMSPAALYIHYKTKEELLHRISRIGHDRALLLLETAADRDGTAAERLMRRRTGLRSLARRAPHHGPGRPVRTRGARRRTPRGDRRAAQEERRRGAPDHQRRRPGGEFDVPDVPGTTLAVLSLCIDVARWFNAQGSRTPDEVGTLYADLVLRMVGAQK